MPQYQPRYEADPEKRAYLEEQKARNQSKALFNKARRTAYEYIKKDSDRLLNEAMTMARKRTGQEEGEEFEEVAANLFKDMKKESTKYKTGNRQALEGLFADRAHYNTEAVVLTDEQRKLFDEDRPYRLTKHQAIPRLVDDLDDIDAKARVLSGRMTPELQKRLDDMMAEERYGGLEEKTTFETVLDIADRPSAMVRGAIAGGLREAHEETADVEVKERSAIEEGFNIATGIGKTIAGGPMAGLMHVLGGTTQEGRRTMGIPVREYLGKIQEDPMKALEFVGAVAQGGITGLTEGNDGISLARELKKVTRNWKDQAFDAAIAELPGGTDEELAQLTKEKYEARLRSDSFSMTLNNPNATEFVAAMALDPMNFVTLPIKQGARLTSEAAKALAKTQAAQTVASRAVSVALAVPGAKQTAKAGQAAAKATAEVAGVLRDGLSEKLQPIRDAYTYLPMVKKMQKLGKISDEAAASFRAAEARADRKVQTYLENATEELGKLEAVPKHERGKVAKALEQAAKGTGDEGSIAMGFGLHGKAMDGFMAARRLADLSWEYMEKFQLNRTWQNVDGVDRLILFKKNDHYDMPHLLMRDEGGEVLNRHNFSDMEWEGRVRRASLKPRSSMKREGMPGYLMDPAAQWRAKLANDLRQAKTIETLRYAEKTATEHGIHFKIPNHAADKDLHAKNLEALRTANPEMDLVDLEFSGAPGVTDRYQEMVAAVGLDRGQLGYAVPREYRDLITQIIPTIDTGLHGVQTVGGVMDTVARRVGQYTSAWRYMKTGTRYAFAARNIIGSFGLTTVTHGLKAFDPELQAKAAVGAFLASSGDPQAMAKLDAIEWSLVGGQKTTMGEIVRLADEVGLMSQMRAEVRAGADTGLGIGGMVGKATKGFTELVGGEVFQKMGQAAGAKLGGKMGRAAEIAGSLAEASTPGYWARATENYQHFVSFLGVLDGTTAGAVDKALDFSSKYTGNFSRMGQAEKGWMRYSLGFYAWNRFIVPRMVEGMIERPTVFYNWAKALGGMDRWFGDSAPFSHQAGADYLRLSGLSAPKYAQLKTVRPDWNADWYTSMIVENPLSMAMGAWPAIGAIFGANVGGSERAIDLAGPVVHFLSEAITGFDMMTGERLPPAADFGSLPEFFASRVGRAMYDVPYSTVKEYASIMELYTMDAKRHDMASEFALRYAAGRAFMGLDNVVAKMLGFEGRSLGGMFDVFGENSTGVPFAFQYLNKPRVEQMRRQRTAVEAAPMEGYRVRSMPGVFFGDEEQEGE